MENAHRPVKYCLVDAFTESPFKGNPAAVCLLEEQRDDEWLKAVVSEFNINVTCFLIPMNNTHHHHHHHHHHNSDDPSCNCNHTPPSSPPPRFHLRWFARNTQEVKICSHATLASSHFLFRSGVVRGDVIEFDTLSGVLTATRVIDNVQCKSSTNSEDNNYSIQLDFPVIPLTDYDFADKLTLISKILNGFPVIDMKKTTTDQDILVVLPSGDDVANLNPRFDEIKRCPGRGVLVTGIAPPNSGFDFISRFFCPKLAVDEDPVCGSAHCALAPYWSRKLGKCDFVAYQASPRGGIIHIHYDQKRERVLLRGKAVAIMEGLVLV